MAVSTSTYVVGLSIPGEVQERIRASVGRLLPSGVDLQFLDSHYVRLLTVRSEDPRIEKIIRDAFNSVCFKKSPFHLVAKTVCLRGTEVLVSAFSSGEPLPGCQNGVGHLRSLYSLFVEALRDQHIDAQCVTPQNRYSPRIEMGRTAQPCSFDAGSNKRDLPEPSLEWQSGPFYLFTKKLDETPTS